MVLISVEEGLKICEEMLVSDEAVLVDAKMLVDGTQENHRASSSGNTAISKNSFHK